DCFFFSSRRRHTRSTRDWSSDVCSSDLALYHDNFYHCLWLSHFARLGKYSKHYRRHHLRDDKWEDWRARRDHRLSPVWILRSLRSEERRVGKECGSRCGW